MKKLVITVSAITILFAAMLSLTGCDSQGINPDLVGTWVMDNDLGITMTLNESGGGRRGGVPGEAFDWTASDRELRINRRNAPSREIQNERWNFTLEGDVLRIESRQQTGLVRYHIRDGSVGEVEPAVVGTWTWDDNLFWEYIFNADGTGTRGFYDDITNFDWGVVDGIIRMRLRGVPVGYINNEHWNFTINGDSLRLESRHNTNRVFSYTRDNGLGDADAALVGQWNWDDDPSWRYILNDDGTGFRGQFNSSIRLFWGVNAQGELRILPQPQVVLGQPHRPVYDITALERWDFSINGDALRLESLQEIGTMFEYTREQE